MTSGDNILTWTAVGTVTVVYRDYRDRYRKMANELGFEGHVQWAEEMP